MATAVKRNNSEYHERVYGAREDPDVTFKLVDTDQLKMGEDLKIKVKVKNASSEHRTIGLSITLSTMYYTGVTAKKVKSDSYDVQLKAQEGVYLFT